eukprot:m.122353 g.122353  ORF g.122353 m.122353 type:complete len:486 (-) comp16559_c0_seq2:1189-2646(-)
MSIDSDHINFLIYRYLQESGFQHSSFTFAQESGVTRTSVASTKIPAGSLIAHLQRALNYVQAEVNLLEDGRPADEEDLEAVEALTLLESVQPEVSEQRRRQLQTHVRQRRTAREQKGSAEGNGETHVAADEDTPIPPERVKLLLGHTNEVVACSWHPSAPDTIASGSGDSTARIWTLPKDDSGEVESVVLRHFQPEGEESRDVTALDWNNDGSLLATGSYDGAARIWTRSGELQSRLTGHSGPIFSTKWSPHGQLLLTSSVDCTAMVWEIAAGQVKQTFTFHTAPCLDVAWQTDDTFASCSTDCLIYVCKLGENKPVHTFRGHDDEVNGLTWDSSERWLASCSDDCTARVWSMESESAVHVLKHKDKIYSLRWCPKTCKKQLLASASCDYTTKIWDTSDGTCLHTLLGHTMPVYSVAFSPDSKRIATGSFDHKLLVWSVETGKLLESHEGGGGIFEVGWNAQGDCLAGCFSDNSVVVLRIQPLPT